MKLSTLKIFGIRKVIQISGVPFPENFQFVQSFHECGFLGPVDDFLIDGFSIRFADSSKLVEKINNVLIHLLRCSSPNKGLFC